MPTPARRWRLSSSRHRSNVCPLLRVLLCSPPVGGMTMRDLRLTIGEVWRRLIAAVVDAATILAPPLVVSIVYLIAMIASLKVAVWMGWLG